MSVDLEFWWCNEYLTKYLPNSLSDTILESTRPLLNLFNNYHINATFFVLGSVAEKYPELIEEIYRNRHEIAIHGYSHKPLNQLTKDDFEKEIKKSLELMSNYNPIGYRAPCFSLNQETSWALKILVDYGFKYDSSIFPMKTFHYGMENVPLNPYHANLENPHLNDINSPIIEFPQSILKMGVSIPFGGGFYFRLFPFWFYQLGIKQINKSRNFYFYIHPKDIDSNIPRIDAPLFSRFVTYYGVNNSLKKMEKLLQKFQFKSYNEVLHDF